MKQETRNKIYAVAGALGVILVSTGVITQDDSTQGLAFVDQGLTIAGSAITLGSTIFAWVKSRPSKVTTIEAPKAEIEAVLVKGETEVRSVGDSGHLSSTL